jgi:hypothetical protein
MWLEYYVLTVRRASSGFIEKERRREVSQSRYPRDFICMDIAREEWDIHKGRRMAFP